MKLLNKIQQEIKAPKTQKNSHGGYMYRSCSDILSAVKPFLSDGVAYLHMTDKLVQVGERNYVEATVTLTQGSEKVVAIGYAREAAEQKGMNSGQLSCSTSSYARKLALSGLFAIDDSHDSGNGKGTTPKAMSQSQAVAAVHAKYIQEHRDDIQEHFSIPLDVFKRAVVDAIKKDVPAKDRAKFKWSVETVYPYAEQLNIADLQKEDNADVPS
jgi:hypothetical protein